MAEKSTIKVPDIGGAEDVDVIEVMVKPGDTIKQDDSLITLESEKASMEIPASRGGKVTKVLVNVGDKVKEGSVILELEEESEESQASDDSAQNTDKEKDADKKKNETEKVSKKAGSNGGNEALIEISIPDIGGAKDVDVIEIMVSEGDIIEEEQALLTLESDKATMDIPAPRAGTIKDLLIKVGDKVSEGTPILKLKVKGKEETDTRAEEEEKTEKRQESTFREEKISEKTDRREEISEITEDSSEVHAGPAVRRMAHELGVDLTKVQGSGRKARITKEDVTKYIKTRLSAPASQELGVPKAPSIDFSKFGEIESKKLNKIKRLTGVNVHRSWVSIPHVTQFDEADITELEAFRKSEQPQAQKNGYKLTVLAFVVKAVYQALRAFPQFNTSLDSSGEELIFKKYYNIGIAVDTPNGLVVPVIQNVDKLSIADIAREMARLSAKAREKGLTPADMSGGCFTISSLGGIGGTAFTPIVNAPEVAILGLSRSAMKPIYINNGFEPRLMLPMSLSYDHRVIDGAEAAHFTNYLAELLSDIRRILLGSQ